MKFIKFFIEVISIEIGINLWFAPQISEHWPKYIPGRLEEEKHWFNRPGIASIFKPKDGIVHEWITSVDEIRNLMFVFIGITKLLSVSKRRIEFKFISDSGIINESNSLLKSEYSYDQYHWCPRTLIEIWELNISSVKYSKWREGIAMKINVIAGIIVQINSISCPSIIERLVKLFSIILIIM